MSLDRRLREAMQRVAETPDLDVETHLERTLDQRTDRPGIPVGLVLTTVTAVLVVVIGLPVLGGMIGPGADPSLSPATPSAAPTLDGVYVTTLPNDAPDPMGLGLAGAWSMTLDADMTVELAPPPAFTGSRSTGHAYSLDGDTFATDLWFNDLCDSIGRYRWSRDGSKLTLQVVEDPCETRRTLLSTAPWLREP